MVKIAIISSSFPPLSSGGISSAQFGLLTRLRRDKRYCVKGFSFLDNKRSESDREYDIVRSGTPVIIKKLILHSRRIISSLFFRDGFSYQFHDVLMSFWGAFIASLKVRKFNPDIVIISDHGCPMLPMKYLVNSKFIWTSHHNPTRFLNNPLIITHSHIDAKLALKIENKCIEKCDVVVAPSDYMRRVFMSSYKNAPLSKTIPNAIDIGLIAKVEPKIYFDDKLRVFIPSASSLIKGGKYIFPIISSISNAIGNDKIQFLLSGHISEELVYEIQHSDIDVIFLGQNPYEDNLAYLKSCDLLLSPTLLESYGMAILEAGLCGVQSISFDVGGNSEIVKEGLNGSLVDYLDINRLCMQAVDMLNNPIDKEIVVKCTNDIYNLEKIDKQWKTLIDEVAQQ